MACIQAAAALRCWLNGVSKDCVCPWAAVGCPCAPSLPAALPPCPPPAGLPQQAVQVWHRANWHWYLKAERRYACCAALRCAWDAAAPLLLHLVAAEGAYHQLQFSRQPSVSRRGTAAVVDGATLLLTPLHQSGARLGWQHGAGVRCSESRPRAREGAAAGPGLCGGPPHVRRHGMPPRHPPAAVVPPPMCAAAAALPAHISCLAISDFGECEVGRQGGGGVPRRANACARLLAAAAQVGQRACPAGLACCAPAATPPAPPVPPPHRRPLPCPGPATAGGCRCAV